MLKVLERKLKRKARKMGLGKKGRGLRLWRALQNRLETESPGEEGTRSLNMPRSSIGRRSIATVLSITAPTTTEREILTCRIELVRIIREVNNPVETKSRKGVPVICFGFGRDPQSLH